MGGPFGADSAQVSLSITVVLPPRPCYARPRPPWRQRPVDDGLLNRSPGILDTPEPSGMTSFRLHLRDVTGGAVATLGIVELFEVVEDVSAGVVADRVDVPAAALTPEQSPIAMRAGLTTPAPCARNALKFQERTSGTSSRLCALKRRSHLRAGAAHGSARRLRMREHCLWAQGEPLSGSARLGTRAGFPATVKLAGTSLVTTAPAMMSAPPLIHTFLPILIGRPNSSPCARSTGSCGCSARQG